MTREEFINYCKSKPGCVETFPFDEVTLVLKVCNKMFSLTDISSAHLTANLKCNPLLGEELRKEYKGVKPGYHMNKKHWNTVELNGDIPDEKLFEMIDHSYYLVVDKLTKKERDKLNESIKAL